MLTSVLDPARVLARSRARPGTGGDALAVAALLALLALAVLVVDPRGDFPLNDDWSFATSARRLALGHDWRPSFWGNMSLVSHSVWSWPFCLFGDCSYGALRASSLVAAALLLCVTHLGMRRAGATVGQAAAGAAAVVFNPVLFELSFTFMTDVFFAAITAACACCFAEHLRAGSRGWLAAATALAVASVLCRQLALCLPLAFAATCVLRPGRSWRSAAVAALPAVVSVGALALYEGWMARTGRTPGLYYVKTEQLLAIVRNPPLLLANASSNAVIVAQYVGLFAAPLTLAFDLRGGVGRASGWARFPFPAAACLASGALAAGVALFGWMPIKGNILVPQGLGPLTLRDAHLLHLPQVPPLPAAFWIGTTLLGALGLFRLSAIALRFAAGAWRSRRGLDPETAVGLFLSLSLALYYAPLLPANVFERYTAAIMPLIAIFCAVSSRRRAPSIRVPWAAAVPLAGTIVFAVLGTHDYLAWNRARWRAIRLLTQAEPADARNMDGGFEYNGAAFDAAPYVVSPTKSWWWVADDRYLIAFGPVSGYEAVAAVPYRNYLPPGRRYIYGLKRP